MLLTSPYDPYRADTRRSGVPLPGLSVASLGKPSLPPEVTQPQFPAFFFFFLMVLPHICISLNSVVSFCLFLSFKKWPSYGVQFLWLALSLDLFQPCVSEMPSSLLAYAVTWFIHSHEHAQGEPNELKHKRLKHCPAQRKRSVNVPCHCNYFPLCEHTVTPVFCCVWTRLRWVLLSCFLGTYAGSLQICAARYRSP